MILIWTDLNYYFSLGGEKYFACVQIGPKEKEKERKKKLLKLF